MVMVVVEVGMTTNKLGRIIIVVLMLLVVVVVMVFFFMFSPYRHELPLNDTRCFSSTSVRGRKYIYIGVFLARLVLLPSANSFLVPPFRHLLAITIISLFPFLPFTCFHIPFLPSPSLLNPFLSPFIINSFIYLSWTTLEPFS